MRDTTTNTSTNTATVDEVIVKGTVTTTSASDNCLVSDETIDDNAPDDQTLDDQTRTLKKHVSRLESELKEVTSHINCLIHGEFDDLRNYVDQALERDRLQKRD